MLKSVTFTTLMLLIPLLYLGFLNAGEVDKVPKWQGSISVKPEQYVNIHYTGKYCPECHDQLPIPGGNKFLKYDGDFRLLCRCHNNSPGLFLHPVDFMLSKNSEAEIPPEYPLQKGKVTCLTCHDISSQCKENKISGISSLRDNHSLRKIEICYKCHDVEKYKMLNPHSQMDKNNNLIDEKCMYCHLDEPKKCIFCHSSNPDHFQASLKDLKLIGNLEMICQRCHIISGNHSGNIDHLSITPSEKAMERLNVMKDKYNIILPFDMKGKLTCITCHNPHDKGVFPIDNPAAKGAGEKYKHRLPGKLCSECHLK